MSITVIAFKRTKYVHVPRSSPVLVFCSAYALLCFDARVLTIRYRRTSNILNKTYTDAKDRLKHTKKKEQSV